MHIFSGMETLTNTFRKNWPLYLIEVWALGMFMIAASVVVIIVNHPDFPIRAAVPSDLARRAVIGICMGVTDVCLIYSRWGKRSGAHLNPAVTLAQWRLNRITTTDAVFYILAQFVGGWLGVALIYALVPDLLAHPAINYVTTVPGQAGIWVAFGFEFGLAFCILTMVLALSNSRQLARPCWPTTGRPSGFISWGQLRECRWRAGFIGCAIAVGTANVIR